ncbi:MFS transporter [Acidimangrovimonas pyrenivorans]|uniref:MFS transporter n=1 Tax=Acidimangrovimonas pyrenivorans TaxID=2030798 RepID=A0ABV7AHZ4_9RHOB
MRAFVDFLRSNAPWLAAGFLLTLLSSFGQTFFISIFSGQIRTAFDLSSGQWGSLYGAATFTSAMAMLYVGGLADRFRVRQLGLTVMLLLALACLVMSRVSSLAGLAAVIFALRLTGQGMMSHTAMVAMARWFVATRGRAVATASLGFAVGEAVLPLGFVLLLTRFDWRGLWLLAMALVLAAIPLLLLLLRRERTPQSFAGESQATGLQGRDWTRGEVLRHPLFWAMVPAILAPAMWSTAFFFHQAHIASVKGWSHLQLVQLFPLFTVSAVGCLMLSGWLVDRYGAGRVATLYLLPAALGYWVLALASSPLSAAPGVMLLGATQGMNSTVGSTFWPEFFGTRHIGKIRSMIVAVMVLGTAIGPMLSGLLIDAGIDFPHQGYGVGLYFIAAAALAAAGIGRVRRIAATSGA